MVGLTHTSVVGIPAYLALSLLCFAIYVASYFAQRDKRVSDAREFGFLSWQAINKIAAILGIMSFAVQILQWLHFI
jgi:hypothetical protein